MNVIVGSLTRQISADGCEIRFVTRDTKECDDIFAQMTDKPCEVTFKRKTAKRSLDANAYAWVLIGKLATRLNVTKEEVYRQVIKDVGAYSVQPIKAEAVAEWKYIWTSRGLGWLCEDIGRCRNTPGYRNIICYYGSSVYDTQQMSKFIDEIVFECKELGIETMTPEELQRLKDAWSYKK